MTMRTNKIDIRNRAGYALGMNHQATLFDRIKETNFTRNLAAFNEFGKETIVENIDGIDYFINEFWTARQRQAHRLHEVSYRACFKPQLPAFFIDRLSDFGDIVYDPFMGRGTTPLEASLKGRVPYGNDTNPLSRALLVGRLNSPTISQVQERLAQIPWKSFCGFEYDDLLAFYHPETLSMIEGLRNWLLKRDNEGGLDNVDQWIRMVAINRLTGHSTGFFSVYTLPPNQAVTVKRQLKINEKRKQTPPLRDVPAIIFKKSKTLLSHGSISTPVFKLMTGQSNNTPNIADKSVTLTVTSPPFLDIVNYESDNWLRCWFLDVDPKKVKIANYKKIEDWQNFVRSTLKELTRITKVGGHIAFEVGEVRNATLRLEETVITASSGLNLELLGIMINQQEFTKTSNCWGVTNNKTGTNSNRIVLFERV